MRCVNVTAGCGAATHGAVAARYNLGSISDAARAKGLPERLSLADPGAGRSARQC